MQNTTESNSLCSFRETQGKTDVKNSSDASNPIHAEQFGNELCKKRMTFM
jgi:hypothetical protein